MSSEKLSYRDVHGTTRTGDFLRKIGKSDILDKVLGAGGELLKGDFLGAISKVISNDYSMSSEDKEHAIQLAKQDADEMKEVSKRWSSDMTSDSWLSKNVRPLVLIYLLVATTLLCFLDSYLDSFKVKEHWVSLLSAILLTTIGAYFGSRGIEKVWKIKRK